MIQTSEKKPVIELLCVGSELLGGKLNTHQSHISLALAKLGLSLARESSLPDELETLTTAVSEALARTDALIICGGLGPTFDDITREAVANALRRTLIYRPALFAHIKRRFKRYRTKMPAENRRQAFIIEGAKVLKNDFGSAPGQMITIHNQGKSPPKTIVMLPGPFAELSPILKRNVLPELKRRYARDIFSCSMNVHMAGITESVADERLKSLTKRSVPDQTFTILASQGQVDFYATATAKSPVAAKHEMAKIRRLIFQAVGRHIFAEGEATLESAVGDILRVRSLSLAAAESCTAGLFSGRVTAVPGSSDYFKGGIVAYSNELKIKLLGVLPETLKRRGAVSLECAKEMAQGARRTANASIGISMTGIAGPSGGSSKKPVGLVYIGLDRPGISQTQAWEYRFIGSREVIRQRAAATALYHLWQNLNGRGICPKPIVRA